MANITGVVGQINSFAGGADTITFPLNASNRGFVVTATGFLLSAATVTVLAQGSSTAETIATTGMKQSMSISDSARLIPVQSVTISGLSAGSYSIAVYQ